MMNDAKIVAAVERGLNKITQSELVNGYRFITGKQLTGSCAGCTKRKAWNVLKAHYDKLIKINK